MKKVLTILAAGVMAALVAVSCGPGKKKIDVQAESMNSLEKMMTAFESGDASEFLKLQEQFGSMLEGLSEGDAAGLLVAFKEFRSTSGGPIFDEKLNDFLWKFTLKADTNAELLTRLYDALEADRDAEGNEELLGVIGSAIDYAYNSPEAIPDHDNFIARIDKWLKKKLISIGQLFKKTDAAPSEGLSNPVVNGNSLGLIEVGGSISSLPASVEGLYDTIKKEIIEGGGEGGDSWNEEVLYGILDGKKVFKITTEFDDPVMGPDGNYLFKATDVVQQIEVISPDFKTENGIGPGSTVEEILAAGGKAYCGLEWFEFYDGILCDGLIFSGLTLSDKGRNKISTLDDGDFIRLDLSDLKAGSIPFTTNVPSAEWREAIEDLLN